MENFTVPTLSLSSSRSRRQVNTSVPTRDYGQIGPSRVNQSSSIINQSSRYQTYEYYQPQQPLDKIKRTHIFPPKAPNMIQEVPKDINKNVYLQSPEMTTINNINTNFSYNED